MGATRDCRICSGALELRIPGGLSSVNAGALAPSLHEPGRHGDLLACRECGSVQQPGLPPAAGLHELYRDMSDDAYLVEEDGRRATARRLLKLIGARAPVGRMLDVGCGHGLLLDEAQRAGYATVGLELSRSGARHAREVLGLDVREVPLEDYEDADGFDVVVLADVLEHLDDPVAGLARCAELLRPGGVLCVVTPDPSSLTARVAGARWWGYVAAHTCLLPRATLREVLEGRGLRLSTDVALVRTFSARRWIGGLAERLGGAGRPLEALAGRLPQNASLSVPLGDERVMLAHRGDAPGAPDPPSRDRGDDVAAAVASPAAGARGGHAA